MLRRKKKDQGMLIVEQNVRMTTEKIINDFLQDPARTELEFPITFTNVHRKFVHDYVRKHGLKSKSHGKGDKRVLTVYKMSKNTHIEEDAELNISPNTQQRVFQLLEKKPLTQKEKCDLAKPLKADLSDQNVFPFRFVVNQSNTPSLIVPPYPKNLSKSIINQRMNLPIYEFRDRIIDVVNNNRAVVISGETGSGKTTQVPQYLLEYAAEQNMECRIICTQPRRLSAISVSERVCVERNEMIGHTVGYQIRLESKMSPTTSLIYCTNGILLRCLMTDKPEEVFQHITHVIVDEVHERDKFSDFLLISLKRALLVNPKLKVLLMSATIDAEIFRKYFFDCPLIEIPGILYDIEINYLEDVLALIGYTNDRIEQLKRAELESSIAPSTSNVASAQSKPDPAEQLLSAIESVTIDDETTKYLDEILKSIWLQGDEENCHQFLLMVEEENVDINYRHSETDMTALMIAAGSGYVEFLNNLLSLGAKASIKNRNELTALDIAVQMNQLECVKILHNHLSHEGSLDGVQAVAGKDSKKQGEMLLEGYLAVNLEDNIDHDLLFALIKFIHRKMAEGSILVFLPGYADIIEQGEKIEQGLDVSSYKLFMLHSNMQTADQKEVFNRMPKGVRKIILSTNLAETSITIEDVVYVIDTGRVKQRTFDAISGSSCLAECWISKACAKQRAGRAGRCQKGVCYRLYSKMRYDGMEEYTLPELLRVPLTDICIQAKLIEKELPIEKFLEEALQPPSAYNVSESIKILQAIGALDEEQNLTKLGIHLGDLPIEVRLGKMLMYSVLLQCLDPVLTIVSALSASDPFLLPAQPLERGKVMRIRHQFAEEALSDHLILLRAFQKWNLEKNKRNEKRFCQMNYIRPGTMDTIAGVRTQLLGHLRSVGFVKNNGPGNIRDLNSNSANWSVVKACIAAGLYPNIARIEREKPQMISRNVSKMGIHMSSVLKHRTVDKKENFEKIPTDWIVYEEKVRIGRYCLSQTNTAVTALTIALFAGSLQLQESVNLVPCRAIDTLDSDAEEEDEKEETDPKTRFIIDDWLNFVTDTNTAYLIFHLRQKMHALFLKVLTDSKEFFKQDVHNPVIKTVAAILSEEDKSNKFPVLDGIDKTPRCTQLNYEVRSQDGQLLQSPQNLFWRSTKDSMPGTSSTQYNTPQRDYNRSQSSYNKRYQPHKLGRQYSEPSNSYSSNRAYFQSPKPKANPVPASTKFFVVNAASREQVLNTVKSNQWNFSSSVKSHLNRILRQNRNTRLIIFFSISSSKTICCLTEFYLKNDKFTLHLLKDAEFTYSYLRNILSGAGVRYIKYLDEYLDGEEAPTQIGQIFFELFMR